MFDKLGVWKTALGCFSTARTLSPLPSVSISCLPLPPSLSPFFDIPPTYLFLFSCIHRRDTTPSHTPPQMPKKSNNEKKKQAEAAGKAPKKTKQQENAGKSAKAKKAEQQVRG